MKYTKEQRLDIGRRIYDGEIDCYQAAEEYSINHYTAIATDICSISALLIAKSSKKTSDNEFKINSM